MAAKVAEFVDLFLFDIKHFDSKRHAQLTGVHNELILKNLEVLLQKRYHVKIRMPLLKGVNDSKEEIEQIAQFLVPYKTAKNFAGIDSCLQAHSKLAAASGCISTSPPPKVTPPPETL